MTEEIKVNCEVCGIELLEKNSNYIPVKKNYVLCCDNCYNKIKKEEINK